MPNKSDLTSIKITLPDLDKEILTCEAFSIEKNFYDTSQKFNLTISDSDYQTWNRLLNRGVKIQFAFDEKPQLTGLIEQVQTVENPGVGIRYEVSGRDLLGAVESSYVNPLTRINANMYIEDFIYAMLYDCGVLGKIYIGDNVNFNISTGFLKGKKGAATQTRVSSVPVAKTIETTAAGKSTVIFENTKVTEVISNQNLSIKKLSADALKPHVGDRTIDTVQRILRRLGVRLWAAADGSGVVIDTPDYTSETPFYLTRNVQKPALNNIKSGQLSKNFSNQHSVVVGFGGGGGKVDVRSKLISIAINELTGLDRSGNPLPEVTNILGQFPHAKVLPIRKKLIPTQEATIKYFLVNRPLFFKEDESRNIEQLSNVVRRKLSAEQKEGFGVTFEVIGFTQNGYVWSPNSLVKVNDDVLGIHQDLWIDKVDFAKDSGNGSNCKIHCILPYSYIISDEQ